ncbi:GDSL esterase/lipase 7-like [Rhododendron vialii]|uniref:GDSL esterase/lipase 7-like n=1 Tax=Rhododendron vialii TaxID=182163 RepID=UPI00265E575F|nr:GDSL esterase/lipase 7-like [Rhododendron vialii]
MLVLLFYVFLYSCGMFWTTCQSQSVPQMYVFGDSIVYIGPSGSHATGMKTGYMPYGLECLFMDKFRFSNGKTIPGYIAAALNVSTPLSMDDLFNIKQLGINYASPSSGILSETGTALGVNYCMEKQVDFFNETVETKLRAKFSPKDKLSKYLSALVYLINIGTSDYIHNYLQPDHYNSSRQYNGEDFAELLTKKLENNLKDLYNIGARKMIVFQIGPLGCYPYIINKFKPRSRCADDINKLVSIFNDKLNGMLKELSEKLDGSSFVTVKTFDLIKRLILSPADYGLAETRWPCCVTQANGTGLCDRGPKYFGSDVPRDVARISNALSMEKEYMCRDITSPRLNLSYSQIGKPVKYICQERDYYLFFDELHLTQAAYKLIVNKCLNSTSEGICSPYGIYHLAEI